MNKSNSIRYVLICCFLFCSLAFSWSAPLPENGAGDVNNDGAVSIVDALMVARKAVGMVVPNFNASAADVDRSGTITILDALMIAQYTIGLIAAFPTPGPGPSVQPTPVPTLTPTPSSPTSVKFSCSLIDATASEDAPDSASISVTATLPPGFYADGWAEIHYTIGGTAINGVDYHTLPGIVYAEIGTGYFQPLPAGAQTHRIEIIPIWDNLQEGTETVIITILGNTFTITISDSVRTVPPQEVTFFRPGALKERAQPHQAPPGGLLTDNYLLTVTSLNISTLTVTDFGGVGHLRSLKYLTISHSVIPDLSAFAACL